MIGSLYVSSDGHYVAAAAGVHRPPGTSGAADPSRTWMEGDETLVRELYRTYGDDLFGFALKRLRDRGLAEELVQDVFTRAWRNAGEFDAARGGLRAWLYGIARNAVIDFERHRSRRPQVARFDALPDDDPVHEPIDDALVWWEARRALDDLTPQHREVVLLGQLGGFSVKEMASVTGLAEGTVRSRKFYALRRLRVTLEEMGMRP
jgi:RNA polymerase sigma-70 factor, ECF subfamily